MPTVKFQFRPSNLRATSQHLKREAAAKFGRKSDAEVEDFLVDEAVKIFLARHGTQNLDAEAINGEGISPTNILYRGLIPGFSVATEASGGIIREVELPRNGSRKPGPTFVGVEYWVSLD